MTFRQQEFARHYAQGKPATKAALAAGYTQSTAETNAARLLRSPEVINEIRRQRNGLRIVTIDDIMRTMTRLMHIIDNAENPAHVLQASAQLFRYLRFQPDVWPEYPDKTDKKTDITPDIEVVEDEPDTDVAHVVEDDIEEEKPLFEASRPQTLSTGPLGPSEPQTPLPASPDNPDKKTDPNTFTSSLLTFNCPPDNPDKNPDHRPIHSPLSTINYQLPPKSPSWAKSLPTNTPTTPEKKNPPVPDPYRPIILLLQYANLLSRA